MLLLIITLLSFFDHCSCMARCRCMANSLQKLVNNFHQNYPLLSYFWSMFFLMSILWDLEFGNEKHYETSTRICCHTFWGASTICTVRSRGELLSMVKHTYWIWKSVHLLLVFKSPLVAVQVHRVWCKKIWWLWHWKWKLGRYVSCQKQQLNE